MQVRSPDYHFQCPLSFESHYLNTPFKSEIIKLKLPNAFNDFSYLISAFPMVDSHQVDVTVWRARPGPAIGVHWSVRGQLISELAIDLFPMLCHDLSNFLLHQDTPWVGFRFRANDHLARDPRKGKCYYRRAITSCPVVEWSMIFRWLKLKFTPPTYPGTRSRWFKLLHFVFAGRKQRVEHQHVSFYFYFVSVPSGWLNHKHNISQLALEKTKKYRIHFHPRPTDRTTPISGGLSYYPALLTACLFCGWLFSCYNTIAGSVVGDNVPLGL